MAAAIAQAALGDEYHCFSAAGKWDNAKHAFVSQKNVSGNAKKAISALQGEGVPSIDKHKPHALNKKDVSTADQIFFLGQAFMDQAKKEFPDHALKMHAYFYYVSKKTSKLMMDIPDPYDGDHFDHYFGGAKPKKGQEASYHRVAKEMLTTFQPMVTQNIGEGFQSKVYKGQSKGPVNNHPAPEEIKKEKMLE